MFDQHDRYGFCRFCAARYCANPECAERAKRDVVPQITKLESAVQCLREIAALKGTSKRQRVNSEMAATWLYAHGYPLEEGGYVPGKGFTTQESKT